MNTLKRSIRITGPAFIEGRVISALALPRYRYEELVLWAPCNPIRGDGYKSSQVLIPARSRAYRTMCASPWFRSAQILTAFRQKIAFPG